MAEPREPSGGKFKLSNLFLGLFCYIFFLYLKKILKGKSCFIILNENQNKFFSSGYLF